VLDVLAASAAVDLVRLVGPEPWLATNDASWFIDGGIGLNEALTEAHAGLPVESSDIRLIVAADLPRLEAADIAALIAPARAGVLAIAPDAAGSGTNALAFPATLDLHFRFGADSRAAHEAEARRLGISAVTIERPGLAFDLDDGAALAQFRAAGSSG
jgi:2-phospho-L-lactate guanylyltransferase